MAEIAYGVLWKRNLFKQFPGEFYHLHMGQRRKSCMESLGRNIEKNREARWGCHSSHRETTQKSKQWSPCWMSRYQTRCRLGLAFSFGHMRATADLAKRSVGRVGFSLDLVKKCIYTSKIVIHFLKGIWDINVYKIWLRESRLTVRVCACLCEEGKNRNVFKCCERASWEEMFTGREFEDTKIKEKKEITAQSSAHSSTGRQITMVFKRQKKKNMFCRFPNRLRQIMESVLHHKCCSAVIETVLQYLGRCGFWDA